MMGIFIWTVMFLFAGIFIGYAISGQLEMRKNKTKLDWSDEELKPCPFCGGKAEIIIFSAEYGTVTVGCTNEECDITMGKAFFTDEEAIQHWNRRVNDETD